MAGHSQFKNIMHRKGRQDAVRSKMFSKLGRELTVAAKMGVPDPDMNPRLRLAIQAAKAVSMPKDNMARAINKATAADTEIGGVMIPSANKALPPMIAGTKSHLNLVLLTNVNNENIPPSPLLSALNVKITYLMVVCKVKVQNIQEIPPLTISASIGAFPIIALITYSGEVPISP